MKYFTHGNDTLATNGIRRVKLRPTNPAGGPPYHGSAQVYYEDGTTAVVSLEFGEALRRELFKGNA